MYKIILISSILVIAAANREDDFRRLDSIHMEPACTSSGGLCVIAEDCPEKARADIGLCPEQRAAGVECCYGLSIRETRCTKHGGECMSFCNPRLAYDKASDCKNGLKCCILVK